MTPKSASVSGLLPSGSGLGPLAPFQAAHAPHHHTGRVAGCQPDGLRESVGFVIFCHPDAVWHCMNPARLRINVDTTAPLRHHPHRRWQGRRGAWRRLSCRILSRTPRRYRRGLSNWPVPGRGLYAVLVSGFICGRRSLFHLSGYERYW